MEAELMRLGGCMRKVAFYTLGCKVNQYETEALTGLFEKEGYETVDFEEKADVYVINTCTVTNLSDRKSRQMIRRAKKGNEDAIVVVVGCYAQTAPEEVSEIPGVNLVVGTKERGKILEYIREIETGRVSRMNRVGNIMSTFEFEDLKVDTYKERTRAFLKIQEGCSQFCAYCIIPYARGPIRSRSPEHVLEEVKNLVQGGFKEVVLTGIHVASYGKDIKNTSLLDMIERVYEIQGIERIRLGSIEPTTITPEFVETVKGLKKLCPHYHISLQSGCDATLERMNRKYTTSGYKAAVNALRDSIPDVAITTDVMVGFPGETEEEFEATFRFLDEISFFQMHVFKYSPRKGTPAATFPEQVAHGKKDERSDRLLVLSQKKLLEFHQGFLGRCLPVLFEQEVAGKPGIMEGLTPNYIRVLCSGNESLKGNIHSVILEKVEEDYVLGRLA
jgi:threonylcarbamoyladenosine tRNA methylthiotransferase MtaB